MNGCPLPTSSAPSSVKKPILTSEITCSTPNSYNSSNNFQLNDDNKQNTTNKDQSIHINIGDLPRLEKPIATETQILVATAKNGIKVETDTDWPAVGATFIVGITIAWLAATTQRSQIRSNVANFRHDWLNNLRSKISELIAKLSLLHSKLSSDKNFLISPASDELYSEIIFLQTTIELMLDRKKELHNELTRTIEEIIKTLKRAMNNDKINELANKISVNASEVLEQAWIDICLDHGLKKKEKFGFLNFLRRN